MFLTKKTRDLYRNFIAEYPRPGNQTLTDQAFVYADAYGIKFLTGVMHEQESPIFAVGIGEDGFVEYLAVE